MKKIYVLCAVLVVLLAGCGMRSAQAAESTARVVNPVSEVTAEEMTQKTGMGFHAPRGAEKIRYYVLDGQPAVAQVIFTLDGKEYTYRAAEAEMDAAALSGVYFGSPTESEIMVVKAKAKLLTEGKTAVLYLLDAVPGISHALTCTDCDDPIDMTGILADVFVPLWDDVPEFVGIFKDDNGNDVILNESENQSCTATVSILRLTEMEGTGALTENGMELTLTDPNGGTMLASFARSRTGTYTLTITNSKWSLLETGTAFEGFWKDSAG